MCPCPPLADRGRRSCEEESAQSSASQPGAARCSRRACSCGVCDFFCIVGILYFILAERRGDGASRSPQEITCLQCLESVYWSELWRRATSDNRAPSFTDPLRQAATTLSVSQSPSRAHTWLTTHPGKQRHSTFVTFALRRAAHRIGSQPFCLALRRASMRCDTAWA